jgi:hypothetical protein
MLVYVSRTTQHCHHHKHDGVVVAGSVKQPGQSCLPPPLVKEGYVTLCCAVPQSDATIQTHQGAAVRKWKAQQGLK